MQDFTPSLDFRMWRGTGFSGEATSRLKIPVKTCFSSWLQTQKGIELNHVLPSCRLATHRNKKWHQQYTSQRRRWQSYERLFAKLVSTATRKDTAEVWSHSKLFSHVVTSSEEMELTPVLIYYVIKPTESPFPATLGLLDETTSACCTATASYWSEMAG